MYFKIQWKSHKYNTQPRGGQPYSKMTTITVEIESHTIRHKTTSSQSKLTMTSTLKSKKSKILRVHLYKGYLI